MIVQHIVSIELKLIYVVVGGGLPVHLRDGRESLPAAGHLRDPRGAPHWLRPCRGIPRSFSLVSSELTESSYL